MATNTQNYNLAKPDGNDVPDVGVINSNMDKIDNQMKITSDRLSTQLAQTDDTLKSESLKSSQIKAQTRNVSNIKTMVTFIDDDGYDGVLDILKPMFTARGVPYVIALRGDAAILQTEEKREQLRDLQNNHGWEMASHTMTHIHLNSSTDKEIEDDSISFLNLMHDYGLEVESMVYPWGERGNTSVISKYYRAGFGTANGVNNGITLDDYNIGRETLGNSSTRDLQFFKDMIDSIGGEPKWLVFMTHVSDPTTNVQQIEDVVDYVISKNIPIVTAKEGLKHYGSLVSSRTNVPSNHADYKYTQIKPDGYIHTNRYLMNYSGRGINGIKITGDSKPSDFDVGVTTTIHNNHVADNLPIGGIMTTTKPNEANGYVRQELSQSGSSATSATAIIYRTSLTGSDGWSNWQSLNGRLWFIPEEETPPSEYPYGETSRNVLGWSKGNGVVKTINVLPSQLHFITQVFYGVLGHRTFVRGVNSSGEWTDWKEVQFL